MRAKGEKKNPIFRQQRFSISRTLRLHTNDSKGAPYYETRRQSFGFAAFTRVLRGLCRRGIQVSLIPKL